MEEYFPAVVQAVAGSGRCVYAYFTDGSIHRYDVRPHIEKGGVFAPLTDGAVFSERLTVLNDTVAWDLTGQRDPKNCIDLDPFTVYQSPAVSDPLESMS